MAKGSLKDRALDDARKKALEACYIPKSIMTNFRISFSSGDAPLPTKSTNESKKSRPAK